eukprot:g27320.t1
MKVHLLCLLANGMFRNRMCNEPELRALALSLVPAELAKVPGGRVQIAYISKLLKWFWSRFVARVGNVVVGWLAKLVRCSADVSLPCWVTSSVQPPMKH